MAKSKLDYSSMAHWQFGQNLDIPNSFFAIFPSPFMNAPVVNISKAVALSAFEFVLAKRRKKKLVGRKIVPN
jgi:hypothetical protein